jgi:hypothetical protein
MGTEEKFSGDDGKKLVEANPAYIHDKELLMDFCIEYLQNAEYIADSLVCDYLRKRRTY